MRAMTITALWVIGGLMAGISSMATAADFYVDLSVTSSGTGSAVDPFKTIQEGLDAAGDGDRVIIRDGTYTGTGNVNLDFSGSSITLQAQNNLGDVIIDCQTTSRAFHFQTGETSQSVIFKIKIINGKTTDGGGGIRIEAGCAPTIRDTIIDSCQTDAAGGGVYSAGGGVLDSVQLVNNIAGGAGGGGYMMYGELTGCTISGNQAQSSTSDAGGLYLFNGKLTGSQIESNSALRSGGGLVAEESIVTDCVITGNTATLKNGGGVYAGGDTSFGASEFVNCVVTNNTSAEKGGGLYVKNASIRHCSVVSNTVSGGTSSGGGVYADTTFIVNSIVWNNTALSGAQIQNVDTTVMYSCVQGGSAGTGNLIANPNFADMAGLDLRLLATSPCISAASFDYATADDIDGTPRYLTPDIGAYESVPATTYTISGTANDSGGANVPGVTVWIGRNNVVTDAFGMYTITGVPPGDYTLIATIEGRAATPNGFTNPVSVTNANVEFRDFLVHATLSGPIYVAPENAAGNPGSDDTGDGTKSLPFASIQKAIFTAPASGTVVVTDGTYTGVWNRDLQFDGKAVTITSENGSDSTRIDCEGKSRAVTFNSGETAGTVFERITIENGYAAGMGGTVWIWNGAEPTLAACTFVNAQAGIGGGLAAIGTATPINLVIRGCTASGDGGGAYLDSASLESSTLYNNTSQTVGGGISAKNAAVVSNCIVWGNTALSSPQIIAPGATVHNSCVDGGFTGTGNISSDPMFADAASGDLHILPSSPCIDQADPATAPATDLDGNPRDTSPDIGAYEYQLFTISGTISGPGASGATVSLTGDGTGTVTTDLSGTYSFTVNPTSAYTVTPTQANVVYSPASADVSIRYGDVNQVDFNSAPGYSVTGFFSGAALNGITINISGSNVLGDTIADSVTSDLSGSFIATLADGNYTLTPQLPGYYFVPVSVSISVSGGNVSAGEILVGKVKKSSGSCAITSDPDLPIWPAGIVVFLLAGVPLVSRRHRRRKA